LSERDREIESKEQAGGREGGRKGEINPCFSPIGDREIDKKIIGTRQDKG